MKDYIKPTFTLAGLVPIALAGSSGCPVTTKDMTDILAKWGITDVTTALGVGEDCAKQVDIYCKYTAIENGAMKALSS